MFESSKYEDMIGDILSSNLIPSVDWNQQHNNTFFLRHDIDFSILHAHQIAKIEEKLNVSATYFFMLTSNMYNIFSKENQLLLKEIMSMGHKVSIHFDPTVYEAKEAFLIERKAFENLFEVEIDIVSIHRPGPFLDDNDISLFGVSQTYQNKYFKDMKYISDSGGRDAGLLVKEYLLNRQDQGLHLLLHPIWWCGKSETPTQTLNKWKSSNDEFLTSEIRFNCKTYLD